MIHVIAIITTKSGQRETVLKAFRENMPTVHAETGCVEYNPTVDASDVGTMQTPLGPDSFVVIEKWASMEALAAHGTSPHMAAYAARVKPFLAARVIHVLTSAA